MTTAPLTLTERMAISATGYGVVIDGILNIRTVTESANLAAYNALYLGGFRIIGNCADPDCTCKVNTLARLMPGAKVVAVRVEISE